MFDKILLINGVIFLNRIILHCDLNNFYASVECVKNPQLQGKPVAVCGNQDDRHGIVLAKSQIAKICGVKTGDTILEARKKCPDLIVVNTDFDAYYHYSQLVKKIYARYTDLIEPFGMDECWLDVTGSTTLFGDGEQIANTIREQTKRETGLTISVGVSFNKIFAKLGSDMKKPDAVTIISRDNFKEKIWGLSASELLFVGRRTTKTLEKYGIYTIGDIANIHPSFLKKILGKNGVDLWLYANGNDISSVAHIDSKIIMKSVSRGITCVNSLGSIEEVQRVIAELCVNVSRGLRCEQLLATGVQLAVKDDNLNTHQYSSLLCVPTHSAKEIFNASCELIKNHKWNRKIRSLSVRTYNLIPENSIQQLTFDFNIEQHEKIEMEDRTIMQIKGEYGKNTIFNGCRLLGTKIPAGKSEYSTLPPANLH